MRTDLFTPTFTPAAHACGPSCSHAPARRRPQRDATQPEPTAHLGEDSHSAQPRLPAKPKPTIQQLHVHYHAKETAPEEHACASAPASQQTAVKSEQKKKAAFIDVLGNHPALKALQSVTGVLMIPMIPLMAYEIYKSSSAPFSGTAEMP